MRKSNFNRIAPVYDFLSQLVFGSDLKKAQTVFLNQINEGDHVLIVGGGTGWILEELNQLDKQITVVYVEPSAQMMRLSKARSKLNNLSIEYLQTPLLEIVLTQRQRFDVVCTFFFLDVFEKETVLKSIVRIEAWLKPKAKWLFSDFALSSHSSRSQKILVKTMFLFFRFCAHIQSKKLLDYQQLIEENGFVVVESRTWRKRLIQSTVFCRR